MITSTAIAPNSSSLKNAILPDADISAQSKWAQLYNQNLGVLGEILANRDNRIKLLQQVFPKESDAQLRSILQENREACSQLAHCVARLKNGQLEIDKRSLQCDSAKAAISFSRGVELTDVPQVLKTLANYGGVFSSLLTFVDTFSELSRGKDLNILSLLEGLKVRVLDRNDVTLSVAEEKKVDDNLVKSGAGRLLKGRVFQIYHPLLTNNAGYFAGQRLATRLLTEFGGSKEQFDSEPSADEFADVDKLILGEITATTTKVSKATKHSGEIAALVRYREQLEAHIKNLEELARSFPAAQEGVSKPLEKILPCLRLVTQGRGAAWRWLTKSFEDGKLPAELGHAYSNVRFSGSKLDASERQLYVRALYAYYQQNVTLSTNFLAPLEQDLRALAESTSSKDSQNATTIASLQGSLAKLRSRGEITLSEFAAIATSPLLANFRKQENETRWGSVQADIAKALPFLEPLFLSNRDGVLQLKEDCFDESVPLARLKTTKYGVKSSLPLNESKGDLEAVLKATEFRPLRDLLLLLKVTGSSLENLSNVDSRLFSALAPNSFRDLLESASIAARKIIAYEDFNSNQSEIKHGIITSERVISKERYESLAKDPANNLPSFEHLRKVTSVPLKQEWKIDRKHLSLLIGMIRHGLIFDPCDSSGAVIAKNPKVKPSNYKLLEAIRRVGEYRHVDDLLPESSISVRGALRKIKEVTQDQSICAQFRPLIEDQWLKKDAISRIELRDGALSEAIELDKLQGAYSISKSEFANLIKIYDHCKGKDGVVAGALGASLMRNSDKTQVLSFYGNAKTMNIKSDSLSNYLLTKAAGANLLHSGVLRFWNPQNLASSLSELNDNFIFLPAAEASAWLQKLSIFAKPDSPHDAAIPSSIKTLISYVANADLLVPKELNALMVLATHLVPRLGNSLFAAYKDAKYFDIGSDKITLKGKTYAGKTIEEMLLTSEPAGDYFRWMLGQKNVKPSVVIGQSDLKIASLALEYLQAVGKSRIAEISFVAWYAQAQSANA